MDQNKQRCSNKHCPQGFFHEDLIGIDNHCKVCMERYKKQFYCLYCHQVYFEFTDDGKNWIQCDQCKGWVHEECADFSAAKNTRDGNVISFKCIRCRKVESEPGLIARRSLTNRQQPKNNKKTQYGALTNIGFTWALKPQQIAEDMKKLQSYLK